MQRCSVAHARCGLQSLIISVSTIWRSQLHKLRSVLVCVAASGSFSVFTSCELLYAGTHGPQPVPQDSDRTPQDTPTTEPPTSEAPQSPPTADSPRPSQPPADDTLSDAQALHPPSSPPSTSPSQPPKGLAKVAQSQGVGQALQRSARSGEDVGGRRQLLREHVVHVTEAAAGLLGLASSEAECKKVPIARLQGWQFLYITLCTPFILKAPSPPPPPVLRFSLKP